MAAALVEPVGMGYGGGGRRGSRSGSKTSLERTGGRLTPERMSNEPDDPEEDNQWLPEHDPRDERGEFESRTQFLLTVIGYALGNGNFWHFPTAMRKFDGASFLVMYFLCMAVFGVPMLYMEMMIGQISQVGPMRAFQLNFPLLQGVGWAVCLLSYVRAINFSLLNAYSLDYAVESLIGVATRTVCTNEWNSLACFSPETNMKKCRNKTTPPLVYHNNSCISLEERLKLEPQIEMPAREYFRVNVRGMQAEFLEGFEEEDDFEFGSTRVIVCFCVVWLFASFCLLRRMRWIGKLYLFVVSGAGVMTVTILIRILSMPRVEVALQKLFHTRMSKFGDIEAWQSAVRLVRTSLNLGLGGMISMSAYNKRSNDAFWDSVIVCAVVSVASISSSITIFIIYSALRNKFPFMDWRLKEKYTTSFMVYYQYYPEVFSEISFESLWSFLFYIMLLALGISTFFGLLETPISALTDQFKLCRKHRLTTSFILCILGLFIGLIQCTRVGYHIFYILDSRVFTLTAEVLTFFQLLTIVLYGPRNFYRDISASIGKKVNSFGQFVSPYGVVIRVCQFIISPILLAFATTTKQISIFNDAWRNKERILAIVPAVPNTLAAISFFPYPLIIAGVIVAIVKHVKSGNKFAEILRPDPMHPSVRYKVPRPLGCIFGLKTIEAMPDAMRSNRGIDFPDKAGVAPAPNKDGEEIVLEA